MAKIRNERWGIIINLTEIKCIIRKYNRQLYANKLDNQIKCTNSQKDTNYQNLLTNEQKNMNRSIISK